MQKIPSELVDQEVGQPKAGLKQQSICTFGMLRVQLIQFTIYVFRGYFAF